MSRLLCCLTVLVGAFAASLSHWRAVRAAGTVDFVMSFDTLSPALCGLDTIDGVTISIPGGGASDLEVEDPSGIKDWGGEAIGGLGGGPQVGTAAPSTDLTNPNSYDLNITFKIPDDESQCITVRFTGTDEGESDEGCCFKMCYDATSGSWGPIVSCGGL